MKKEPGKYYKNAQIFKHLVRPKQKKMSPVEYVDLMNRLYNSEPLSDEEVKKRLDEERYNDKILKRDKYEVKPKKKIVSLDKPQKPLPFNLDRWLDEIDPQWWILPDEIEPEEEAKNRLILKNKMKVAEGIETLLALHRRLT